MSKVVDSQGRPRVDFVLLLLSGSQKSSQGKPGLIKEVNRAPAECVLEVREHGPRKSVEVARRPIQRILVPVLMEADIAPEVQSGRTTHV